MSSVVRILLLAVAVLSIVAALLLLQRPAGPRDSASVSGPTVVRVAQEEGGPVEPLLAYSGMSPGQGAALLARPLKEVSKGGETAALLAPGAGGKFDSEGISGAQFVAPDRIYYVGKDNEGHGVVGLARWTEGAWRAQHQPILPSTWAGGNVAWLAVTPPGEAGREWRMWFVGRTGTVGRLGYAASLDGLRWQPNPQPVLELPDGGSVETISVQLWAGELRAWSVIKTRERPQGELVGLDIGPDGVPMGEPEPVAWQAPELRFGNLPKDMIPIVDARAEPGSGDRRHIRLYITYREKDGKTKITVAENFPVAGERSPTIFARQVKPLVVPGSDRSGPTKPIGGVVVLTAIGVLAGLLGSRRTHPDAEEPSEELDAEALPLEETLHVSNGTGAIKPDL